ncbi:MAG: hypothetical protein IPL41_11655 [Micropruina sp.]|nr:hypothetical protein [Micropruina sp.]
MSLVDLIGWSATCVGALLGLPQLLRLLRTKSVDGLSLVAWRAMLVLNLAWFAHGVRIDQLPQMVTNAVALAVTLPLLILLVRSKGLPVPRTLAPSLVASAAIIGVDAYLGSLAFGIVAMIPGLFTNLGQSVELIRAPSVGGVAPLFLLLGWVNQCLWLSWALLVHDPGTTIAAGLTLAMTSFNLAWFGLRRLGVRAIFVRSSDLVEATDEPALARA